MAQQTAVMQLINFILVERRQEDGSIKFHAHDDFSRFLQIEKKQILDAIVNNQNGLLRRKTVLEAEQYYKQTYG